MPQLYPDGPSAVSLNAIQSAGELNTPEQESFDTPALQGTMQQLLSENLGRFAVADFLVGVSTIVRRVGVLYSVGRGFMVLYLRDYAAFEVCDIFSLKFITFFPPGNEPTLSDLERGAYQDVLGGALTEGPGTGILRPAGSGPAAGEAAFVPAQPQTDFFLQSTP
ncbi:MAG: hypothetical protein LUE91_04860, partial [Oscillospiraceae bacterium]|nr:hypothetical protein [Oscillospiraceae bacterium]